MVIRLEQQSKSILGAEMPEADARVRLLEAGAKEEVEFDLVEGRVEVNEVLKEYSAILIIVKLEGGLMRELTPASDGLSEFRFDAGSLHVVHVIRSRGIPRVLPADRVEQLLHLFQKQLVTAREAVVDLPARRKADLLPLTPDGNLDRKLGSYFMLAGREQTLTMQIKGAAQIFGTFMSYSEDVRECDSLLMAVGFPGVGKTTLGRDTTALLRRFWDEQPDKVEAILREVLSAHLVEEFKSMVGNSASYNCRMYRSLEATTDGQTLPEESGLGESQLLALNTLFASLTLDESKQALYSVHKEYVRSYEHLLHRLEADAPGLKEQLLFSDVVTFIRRGLGIPDGNRILLSWFFDEANVARPAPGRTVSWFQEMMSRLVHWMHSHRRGQTFVVATAATTRFSVATLRNTASGRAHSVFIPLQPLSLDECKDVVVRLLERLSKTVKREGNVYLTEGLQDVIALSGGNPRMLSYILTAFCTSSLSVDLPPAELFSHLCQPMRKEDMENVILRAWKLIKGDYYAGYVNTGKMVLVLRAMQASLLGERVTRIGVVLQGKFSDTWGDLESEGLVGLTSGSMESAVVSAEIPMRVCFSTMILRYIFSLTNDALSKVLPPLESSDWKVKEKADLYTIMFMILLHWQVTGRATFKLADILPQDWFVPAGLEQLEFVVPSTSDLRWSAKQAQQLKSPAAFWQFMNDNATRWWAFIGPHNWGADSWLRLVCANTGKVMLLVIESKCCGCPQTLPVVKYAGQDSILDKAEKDLNPIILKPVSRVSSRKRKYEGGETSTATGAFGLDQVVFLYMSDQDITSALEQHKANCDKEAMASRVIVAQEHPRDSPLCKMSAVRHMMVFTQKDNCYV